MHKKLNDVSPCPNCGQPMPTGALAGFCPACLLAQGAETQPEPPTESNAMGPGSMDEVARMFPQLEILGFLGMGGMGAVYKARQPALDRLVAVKLLPSGNSSGANFNERFNREARALARLSHPNIVAVHEFGQVQGQPFFIMEFVDGANLRQLERAQRLSPREVLEIIPQICDALQYAHDQGVVHRDIKPENVLLDRRGRVKIADFGLAKILERNPEAMRLTAEGQIMGTPHYMAPEQVERPLAVDHRADIYSLGVVFYEMLTGDLPIGKFAPPSRKVEVDVRLDEVVLRALENDPERRYQQVSEVKHRISSVGPASGSEDLTEAAQRSEATSPLSTIRKLRWLGIPIVVERDGEREVSFNGALTGLVVVLACVALGLFLVRMTTHREHASPMLGVWIGILTLAWAVRRTLRRPVASISEERTDRGTVILSPPRRFAIPRDYWALAGILVGVVGLHFLFVNVAGPLVQSLRRPAMAESQAKLQPDSRTMLAALPGEGAIELLAVAHRGATPKQWWLPDGSLDANVAYELRNPVESSMSGKVSKDMVFRVSGFGRDAEGPFFETEPAGPIGSGGSVYRNGQLQPGLLQARIAWPPDARRGIVRAGFSVDPWRTVIAQDAHGQKLTQEIRSDDPRWDFFIHSVSEVVDGAQVTVLMGRDYREWRTRVVAVDTNGVVRTQHRGAATPRDESTIWTYTFLGLPLAEVKEFRVEVRRIRWVEFLNVALEPKDPVPAPEPLRFGEVMERSFDELIDFDTGAITNYPPPISSGQFFDTLADGFRWAFDNGYDAEASLGELNILQMNFGLLRNEDWDVKDPQFIMDKHYQSTFRPPKLGPLKDGKLPVTYSFETREGTLGVVQLIAFDPDRPGATLRFKHLIR